MSNSVDPGETAHMSRLIWIYAVCKNLLLSPMAVKELTIQCEFQFLYLHIILFMKFSVIFYLTRNIFLNARFWTARKRNLHTTSR